MDDNTRFRPLDPEETCKEIAKHASYYGIENLDGKLAFDDNVFYSLGGFSTVSFGNLQLKEEGSGLVREKVSLLPNHNFSVYLMGRERRWL